MLILWVILVISNIITSLLMYKMAESLKRVNRNSSEEFSFFSFLYLMDAIVFIIIAAT